MLQSEWGWSTRIQLANAIPKKEQKEKSKDSMNIISLATQEFKSLIKRVDGRELGRT